MFFKLCKIEKYVQEGWKMGFIKKSSKLTRGRGATLKHAAIAKISQLDRLRNF